MDAAQQEALGLLEAALSTQGRLPELFCGLDRADVHTPVPFPTSCSPQMWATAVPFLLHQVLLGLEPDVPAGSVTVSPALPRPSTDVELLGARFWNHTIDIVVRDGGVEVSALDGLRLVT